MKAIEFYGHNVVIAENQPPFIPLPAFVGKNEDGHVVTVSCWEPSEEEVKEILKTRKIYVISLTYGQQLQPLNVEGYNPLRFEDNQKEGQ